jgi:hypothetical protein
MQTYYKLQTYYKYDDEGVLRSFKGRPWGKNRIKAEGALAELHYETIVYAETCFLDPNDAVQAQSKKLRRKIAFRKAEMIELEQQLLKLPPVGHPHHATPARVS